MKPMIKYRGGKSKEIKYFEDYMPSDYSRFIEPFVGGGAVFFYLEPSHAFTLFAKKVVREQRIPFEISAEPPQKEGEKG